MEENYDFFWRKATEYRSYYNIRYCGYVEIACCIVIVISNTILVLVFTRKNTTSPTNTIFIHMAISESLASISYLPRAWHEFIRIKLCAISEHRTYIWEMISLNSYKLAYTFRHLSVWFALMLAVWRYMAIIQSTKERHWCNMEMTRKWIIAGYIIVILSSIPPHLALDVGLAVKCIDQNGCLASKCSMNVSNVTVFEFQIPLENYPTLYGISLAFYGFFIEFLPSVVLGVISFRIIVVLIQKKEHRNEVINMYNQRVEQHIIKKQIVRVTKIWIIILVLFVMSEMPRGIFCMINAYIGPEFFWSYNYYMMEIFNMFTHICQSFNFLIYYSMSNQFRNAFKTLFNHNKNRQITI